MRLQNHGSRMKQSDAVLTGRCTLLCMAKRSMNLTRSQALEMAHLEQELRARGVLGDEPRLPV